MDITIHSHMSDSCLTMCSKANVGETDGMLECVSLVFDKFQGELALCWGLSTCRKADPLVLPLLPLLRWLPPSLLPLLLLLLVVPFALLDIIISSACVLRN